MDELTSTSTRPFTTMGSATLQLESLQGNDRSRKASTAGVSGAGRLQAADGEFDVRKFILDQKGSEPLHQSALFRPAPFFEKQSQLKTSRSSPRLSRHQQQHNVSPDRTKRSKKLLPKMVAGASKSIEELGIGGSDAPKTQTRARTASANQPRDEDYDTVSHFYTIERMAESCCNAAQRRNKTWHFLPGSEERSKGNNGTGGAAGGGSGTGITGVERPSRRVDVLDLEKCFEIAMQFASKRNDWDVACDEKTAMIDRDFVLIETRVANKYSPASCNNLVAPTATPALGTDSKSIEDQKVLVKLFFEQKWSDVVLGELEAMLTTSFLEQGVLLRNARIQYAQAFYQLEKLYCARFREHKQALRDLETMRQEVSRETESHQRDTEDMKEQYETEIKRLHAGFDARREEMERKVVEAKEQMAKMGDTMKTLNTIFRQMREDTEKVKAVELRENYNKLEKKYELSREEIEKLRPLVHENQRLAAEKDTVESELDALKESVASMSVVLASKDDTIASLMEQHSDMLAAQELQAAREEERQRRAQDEADDEEEDQREANAAAPSLRSDEGASRRPRERQNSVGVCVRCKQELRQMARNGNLADLSSASSQAVNAAGDFESADSEPRRVPEPRKRRIQCLYFRILLPNLRGRRPHREMAWTLSCMRSIMFAKQIDDAMCRRSGGVYPLRVRMPEFVYAWFSPWRSLKDEKNSQDDLSSAYTEQSEAVSSLRLLPRAALTAEQQQLQADEDRWCLYYGVKHLVQEGYLEAKLFLSLLDEKYGEDELVFMMYCYRVLDILIGGRLHYGPLRDTVSYVKFAQEYDSLGLGAPDGSRARRVPKTIWISPRHASLATSVVLSKATEAERAALDQKIMNYVVTNVPEDERPGVFLPADHAQAAKKRHPVKTHRPDRVNVTDAADDDSDADSPPQQFVDANLWVELMMLEYKEEQAHRRAAIRLMFQTATGTSLSGGVALRPSDGRQPPAAVGGSSAATMDMEQFRIMIRTLNDEIPAFVVAVLFRNTYVRGSGAVNFDAFMDVAESAQFFSSCMRLESPAAGIARLSDGANLAATAALSTSSRAAYVVGRYFTIMRKEVSASVEALPLWTRSATDQLACEIASCLEDSNDVYSDGVRLLTSFHRLVDNLLLAKLVKHETTGGLFHSKTLFSMEKALTALLECVRLRDKSSVEILIDTVKQRLCVQRMQAAFRKQLQRDQGAPLAMRSLLHPNYGKRASAYRSRLAERPLKWLLFVISAVFRYSMRPERNALILELSMTSSSFHGSSATSAQRSSTLNGGAGPAPRPLLLELIYDFFLDKFGTRWEAEKLVHDVFVNCRAYAKENATVMLFSALCSMSNASPDDGLLGQNEALAFLHAIFRCGLHNFGVINPSFVVSGGFEHTAQPSDEAFAGSEGLAAGGASRSDGVETRGWLPIDKAESILLGAFSKLSVDQKHRLRARIEEAATPRTSAGGTSVDSRGDGALLSMAVRHGPKVPRIEAGAFLVLALSEWKRYAVQRMNEVKMVCCTLDEEMRHFEAFNQIEAIANVLQKSDVAYRTDDLCVIFRRFCSTERHGAVDTNARSAAAGDAQKAREEPISDRLAAACFPVLAREPLAELQTIENRAAEPFALPPNPAQNYELLVESWNGYQKQFGLLLESLRRVGKSNDIQAESHARRSSALSPSSGNARGSTREVLYLSSSTSVDRLSSQDVAQLEAVYLLFLERMERLQDVFERERLAAANRLRSGGGSKRNSVVGISVNGSLALVDDMHSHTVMVNETWKIFRQVLLGFTKLRALASLGTGMLPDEWSH